MTGSLKRAAGWVALVAFLGGFSLPLVNVHVGDPDSGDVVSLVPGHAQEQFEAVQLPGEGGHCVLCHWLRAVGGLSTSLGPTATPAFLLRDLEVVVAPSLVRAPARRGRASRAPPVLSV